MCRHGGVDRAQRAAAAGQHAGDARRWLGKVLLKFDLSVVPGTARVISATLSLRTAVAQQPGPLTVRCYEVKRRWEVNEATWTKATTTSTWKARAAAAPATAALNRWTA